MPAEQGSAPRQHAASRIEMDAESIKTFATRVDGITERIIGHARALGYFEPPPNNAQNVAPTAVITTLADAIQALDRAIGSGFRLAQRFRLTLSGRH